MKHVRFLFLPLLAAACLSAAPVTYNTTFSTLLCPPATPSCTQNNSLEITEGGLHLTYTPTSTSVTPNSILNLGFLTWSGSGSANLVAPVTLTIDIFSNPPGGSGSLPTGSVTGTISTNSSGDTITFAAPDCTTGFGTLPCVQIGNEIYQVLNPALGLEAPTVGNPVGQTTIQGAITQTPEPATAAAIGSGLLLLGLARRKRS